MNFLSKINHIPLKYVAGMNIAIIAMAITFVSIRTVSQTTDNRSKATETAPPSPMLTIAVNPASPPKLLNSDPDWAKIGDALFVRGENLGSSPFGELFIGAIPVPYQNIVEWAPDHLVITIPHQAETNPLTLKFNQNLFLQTSNLIRIVDTNQSGL